MNPILELGKWCFYQFYPSAFVSAYIRTLYLKRYVRTAVFSRALDAGCGPGLFTLFLAQRFPASRFTGYDLSEEYIRACREEASRRSLKNVVFQVQDLIRLSESERYDFVYSIDCLEHIPSNQRVIVNLVNALELGGVLYLAMPCEKIHRYLFPKRYFEKYVRWASEEHIGDQYTREELVTLLRSLGLEILQARYTFGLWGKLAWELDMLTDGRMGLKRLLLPFLFCLGALDPLFSNTSGPYGVVVIGKKLPQGRKPT